MTTVLGRSIAPEKVPDDRRGGIAALVPLFVATALSVGLAARSVPVQQNAAMVSIGAGTMVAALAIFLLQSIPARWASRAVVLLGAAIMVRYGETGGVGAFSSFRSLWWAGATVAAFVLGARLESASVGMAAPEGDGGWRRLGVAQAIAVPAALDVAAALTFGPRVSMWMSPTAARGEPADVRDRVFSNPMIAGEMMDAGNRPRLSDRLVMTVRSARPSFWRTATYDRFDGRRWTRSNPGATIIADGAVTTPADDLSARSGEVLVQRIRLDYAYAEVLPVAPSAVSVVSESLLAQWEDGTILAADSAMGRGTSYTVTSRQIPVTRAALDAADATDVPTEILRRYASRPLASDRVAGLAEEIAGGLSGTRAKVDALIRWMGANLTYSLDAPLPSPTGDVVEEFLFETQQGWCEQISSALTVMLRTLGIPTRVATGFVPGSWDPVSQAYRVRASDAHAWTEVWFAGVGWVPFDPTAAVPAAGSTSSGAQEASWWWDHAGVVLVVAALAFGLVGPLQRGVGRVVGWVRDRRCRRRGSWAPTWVGEMVFMLERRGRRDGRPRAPNETVTGYSAVLADRWDDDRVAELGVALDEVSYGSGLPPDDPQRREHIESLARSVMRDTTPAS